MTPNAHHHHPNSAIMNFTKALTIAGSAVNVTVTSNAAVVDSFVRSNISAGNAVIGLDVEWNSAEGADARPALLQICCGNSCLVVQLLHVDYVPQSLKNLLLNPNVTSVGVGITNDVAMLKKLQIQCSNSVELGPAAARAKGNQSLAGASLAELARAVLGVSIVKDASIARSNWAANILSEDQILYAATDAFVGYCVGSKLIV